MPTEPASMRVIPTRKLESSQTPITPTATSTSGTTTERPAKRSVQSVICILCFSRSLLKRVIGSSTSCVQRLARPQVKQQSMRLHRTPKDLVECSANGMPPPQRHTPSDTRPESPPGENDASWDE